MSMARTIGPMSHNVHCVKNATAHYRQRPTLDDVYTVNDFREHYICGQQETQERLSERLLIAFLFVFCVFGSIFLLVVL